MAARIQAIFIDPPIAVARLGGSSTPMESFRWVDSSDPHLQTVIAPDWSLDVDADGVATPRLPDSLSFRDGGLIRPVAPFFELWTLMGEDGSDPATWQQAPLTLDVLTRVGGSFTISADARNRKAARRARKPDLQFGTFPRVEISSDNNRPVALIAKSPPGAARPMMTSGSIPYAFALRRRKERFTVPPAFRTRLITSRPSSRKMPFLTVARDGLARRRLRGSNQPTRSTGPKAKMTHGRRSGAKSGYCATERSGLHLCQSSGFRARSPAVPLARG